MVLDESLPEAINPSPERWLHMYTCIILPFCLFFQIISKTNVTAHMCLLGQRLRIRSRSDSHSEPGTGSNMSAKKREWNETSEASQEEDEEEEGEGQRPEAKRLAQGAGPIGHLRWVNVAKKNQHKIYTFVLRRATPVCMVKM